MALISVTNKLFNETGINFDDLINGLTDGTKDLSASQLTASSKVLLGDGTVSLPGLAFTTDVDSGIYRIGSNNLGIAVNATKILDIKPTGLTVAGNMSATTINATGAENLKLYTYTHTLSASEALAATYHFTVTAVNLAKVRRLSATMTDGSGTLYPSNKFTALLFTSTTDVQVNFGGLGIPEGWILSCSIEEAT